MNIFTNKKLLISILFFFISSNPMELTEEQEVSAGKQILEALPKDIDVKNKQSELSSVPSPMQNLYSAAMAKLEYAKSAATGILFGSSQAETLTKDVTLAQAHNFVQQVFKNMPAQESTATEYWRKNSVALLRATKILYEESQKQILKILEEIDKRLLYWRYQKDHPLSYFFSKSPLKWITGKSQNEEIITNIDLLQNKQDELYTRLGQLSSIDLHEYLMAFNDYKKAYEWMEKVCNILVGIAKDETIMARQSNYKVIVKELLIQLRKVNNLVSSTLLELKSTEMPYHVTRNWVRYAALLMGAYYAYNSPEVEKLIAAWPEMRKSMEDTFLTNVKVIKDLINETFFGGRSQQERLVEMLGGGKEGEGLMVTPQSIGATRKDLESFLNKAQESGEALLGVSVKGFGVPGLSQTVSWSSMLTDEQKKVILDAYDKRDSAPFEQFFNQVMMQGSVSSLAGGRGSEFVLEATALFIRVLRDCLGISFEKALSKIIDQLDKESKGARNLALIAPATIAGWIGYSGLTKLYGKLTARDYSLMRLALLDIGSLFVDQTRPLDDLEYGKMIYLLYNLKEKTRREFSLPADVRNNFIKDLDRIELREFDVAAKRRIVKDMFKRYPFLGFVV